MFGPIEYVVVAFDGNKFNGKILPELERLSHKDLIRVVDLLFIIKDDRGKVDAVELSEMPEEVLDALGELNSDKQLMLSPSDVDTVAERLENNSSAAILVYEHLWAKKLRNKVEKAGGVILDQGYIDPVAVEVAVAANKEN